MHFVFLTMEATNNSTLKAASDELNRKFQIGLEVSCGFLRFKLLNPGKRS